MACDIWHCSRKTKGFLLFKSHRSTVGLISGEGRRLFVHGTGTWGLETRYSVTELRQIPQRREICESLGWVTDSQAPACIGFKLNGSHISESVDQSAWQLFKTSALLFQSGSHYFLSKDIFWSNGLECHEFREISWCSSTSAFKKKYKAAFGTEDDNKCNVEWFCRCSMSFLINASKNLSSTSQILSGNPWNSEKAKGVKWPKLN